MKTTVSIEGEKFLINGRPAYEGVRYRDRPVEGLLMNSRMIQALFDDENPQNRPLWQYPDTGVWDPDRNTDEFCAQLPAYRACGLLAVTVGLQGGGSVYTPAAWEQAKISAFTEEGALKPPWFDRLLKVLKAADENGMVVIVNYLYWKQVAHLKGENVIGPIVEKTTRWLLETGYRNILVDIANECAFWWQQPALTPDNIHRYIDQAKHITMDGRRLLVSASTGGGDQIPSSSWLKAEDFSLPHGNGCDPESLKAKLAAWRSEPEFKKRPRPLLINEDSVRLDNMEAAVSQYCSWGYYSQGAGSRDQYYDDQWGAEREKQYEDLSGFQTVPVNWGINTPRKKSFFDLLKEITQGK